MSLSDFLLMLMLWAIMQGVNIYSFDGIEKDHQELIEVCGGKNGSSVSTDQKD